MQDAPAILSLSSFAAGAGTAQKTRPYNSGSERVTFANFAGDPAEASRCIGARGLRDGRAGLLPTIGSRQPSPAVPGLRVGGEKDEDVLGWKYRGPRKAGAGPNPRDGDGRPQSLHSGVRPRPRSVLPWVQFI